MLRILLGFFLLTTSIASWSVTLEGIRLSQTTSDTRLVFDFSDKVQYKTFTLRKPDRLVIDIIHTTLSPKLALPKLENSVIRAIRHAAWDKNTLRVVLDLKQPQKYETHSLKPAHNHPDRLVIDLHSITSQKTTAIAINKVKPQPKTTIAKKIPTPPTKKVVKPAQITPKPTVIKVQQQKPTITVTKSTKTMAKRDIIIAIDPGHGGKDSGAIGKYGTQEKNVVLAIAKRLAKLVNNEPGMRAYLTRDHDVFIPLRHRIKRARDHHADMFISIHADAFKNTHARGASVFVLSEHGASSEAAQLLADKENAADLAGGISLEDKDDLLASVLLDLSQTASLEGSLEVGKTILSGLKRIGHVHNKHVESAAFVVLKSPDIPSVLVETAFISNPTEEYELKTVRHQQKLARAIMSGIRTYFKRNPLPGKNIPQQHIVSRGDTLSTIAQRYRVSVAQLKNNNHLSSSVLTVGEILLIP